MCFFTKIKMGRILGLYKILIMLSSDIQSNISITTDPVTVDRTNFPSKHHQASFPRRFAVAVPSHMKSSIQLTWRVSYENTAPNFTMSFHSWKSFVSGLTMKLVCTTRCKSSFTLESNLFIIFFWSMKEVFNYVPKKQNSFIIHW